MPKPFSALPASFPLQEARQFFTNQWSLNHTLMRYLGPLIESKHHTGLQQLMLLNAIQAGIQYPTELAYALQLPKHRASRLIDDLLKGSLIERSIDHSDSRRTRLEMTPAGQQLLEAANSTVDAVLERLFNEIPAQQRAQVIAAVELLAQAAQKVLGNA